MTDDSGFAAKALALVRELTMERMATLAAMRELLTGYDELYRAHFGGDPTDDIAAKAARRILDGP